VNGVACAEMTCAENKEKAIVIEIEFHQLKLL
jgi:hypothetical protein